jgi:putative photosynthetic complex assembly protein
MSHTAEPGFPRAALYGAGALIPFAMLMTLAVRIGVVAPSPSASDVRTAAGIRPLASRDLLFLDRADGAVEIREVGGGVVASVEPGTEHGFIRGVMRGLARERRMKGYDSSQPFQLTLWADNSLSLTDRATGRVIDLGAFGSSNRAVFAAMLPKAAA